MAPSSTRLPVFESVAAVMAVAIMGLMVALPGGSSEPKANSTELKDALNGLRTGIFRFTMEHRNEAGSVVPGRSGLDLIRQLTGQTRRDGTYDQKRSGHDDRTHGALLKSIPANPVNGLNTIRSMPEEVGKPDFRGRAGWVYVPKTGKIYPDLPGEDRNGVPYSSY